MPVYLKVSKEFRKKLEAAQSEDDLVRGIVEMCKSDDPRISARGIELSMRIRTEEADTDGPQGAKLNLKSVLSAGEDGSEP